MFSRQANAMFLTVNIAAALCLLLQLQTAIAAPAKLDSNETPFALELQPPILDAGSDGNFGSAIDSYGNPIDTLKPIDTPDGRKVVSAQGLQFEIPNYASGITEIRKPADDLLPPHIDAIAVALPGASAEDTAADTDTDTSFAPQSEPQAQPATSLTPPNHSPLTTTTSTEVEVEQAELQSLQRQEESVQAPQLASGTLPDYILELQDADIAGPVPWTPAPNAAPLSVIAWDLLPPHLESPAQQQQPNRVETATPNIQVTPSSSNGVQPLVPVAPAGISTRGTGETQPQDGPQTHGTNAHVDSTSVRNPGRFPTRNRGTVHYSTTPRTTLRPRISSTTTPTTTTTTRRSTTTTRATTTTTTTTTTARPTTTRRTTTTAAPVLSTTPLDPSTFYKLDNEESYAYTLPPWLQEVTDPDLDVAVTFAVPTDNDKYNHSVANDLEPPFEPFVDLRQVHLTPPPTDDDATRAATTAKPTTSTTTTRRTTTTTTPRPTTTATSTTTTTKRPNWVRFTSPTASSAPTSTTNAPITINKHHTQAQEQQQQQQQPQLNKFKYTTAVQTTTTQTDPLGDAANAAQQPNPFDRFSTSTTTTTTTTTAATLIEPNPFDSATVPSWLADLDYPDVGPGVPYNPDNFKDSSSSVTNAGNAGAHLEPQNTPTPPPRGVHEEQFPPFEQQGIANNDAADNQKFEYSKSEEGKVITTPVTNQFNSQRKDTQTNSVFSAGSSTVSSIPPAAPTGSQANRNTGKYTGGFGAPAGLLRPQAPAKPDIYVAGNEHEYANVVKANKARPTVSTGRYTGGFGAPSGVLAPQSNNEPRPFQTQQQQQRPGFNAGAAIPSVSHQSRFGGPPGVLVPFDNVQRAAQQ